MAQVFISYKSTERPEVAKIAEGLIAEGFTVWWDHALLGGQDYSRVIETEIAAAKVVMPVWSAQSLASRWVSAEAIRGGDKLFPVKIDDIEPPLPFNSLHTIDLTDWNGDRADARWQRLVADLRAVVSGVAAPLQSLPSTPTRKRGLGAGAIAALVAVPLLIAAAGYGVWRFAQGNPATAAAAPSAAVDAVGGAPAPAPGPAEPAGGVQAPATATPVRERGIGTFAQAVEVIRQTGGRVSLEICAANGNCGATRVRVGEVITVRVRSQVAGRLILLDQNSMGEQTQIFPNGLSRSGSDLTVNAGETIELPFADHGFSFGVTEPAGPSRLIAMILPVATPVPAIVAENRRERGIGAIPADRRNEFAASVTQATETAGSVAVGELSYVVTN